MKKKYPYIILGIIGVLIIAIAFLLKSKNIETNNFSYEISYEILLNIGFIILAIVIVNFLWSLLGGDPMTDMIHKSVDSLNLASDGLKGGLNRAFLSSSDFSKTNEWIDMLENAKEKVDMMGYSLYTLTRSNKFNKTLENLANKGVKIRILIMDQDNPYFDAGLNYDCIGSLTADIMKNEVVTCSECVEQVIANLSNKNKNNLSFVKIKKGITECQIIRIDNHLYATPYLYSKNTSDSPLFIYKEQKDGYYYKYLEEFEVLWKINSI